MFILGAERGKNPHSFAAYRAYLHSVQGSFPPSAYKLATSDWYYSLNNRRGPHDAWLQEVRMVEHESPDRHQPRKVEMVVRLLNAHHDHVLQFRYPTVLEYSLQLTYGLWGHRDWRYDEFRLSDDGKLIHEIEWAGPQETGRWLIVSDDVHYDVSPIDRG